MVSPGRTAALAAALFLTPYAAAQTDPAILNTDPDRTVRVLTLLASKCAECHGSHLAEPEDDFGYILDIPRMIEEKQIIPGKPEESRLYRLMVRGKMPPEDARSGPVSPEDVELIRRWIAGEPEPAAGQAAGASAASPAAPAPRTLILLGRLHPLTVHFPIGLLIAAVLADALAWRTPRPGLATARTFCIVVGALGAVAAAGLGWLNAWAERQTGETLDLHRWLGTAAAIIAVGAAAFTLRAPATPAPRYALARLLLFGAAVLTGIAAHFGGLLVHGPNYYAP